SVASAACGSLSYGHAGDGIVRPNERATICRPCRLGRSSLLSSPSCVGRRPETSRRKGLEIQDCPFVNLPQKKAGHWGAGLTKEKMADCIWLRPQLVAQIEFLEWTPDGNLRHTKFAGMRDDKAARSVVREESEDPER